MRSTDGDNGCGSRPHRCASRLWRRSPQARHLCPSSCCWPAASGCGFRTTPRRSSWCWRYSANRRDPPAGERSRLLVHLAVRHAAELRRTARDGHGRDEAGCVRRASILFFESSTGPGEDFVLGCVTNVSENLQSCTKDGRRPPGVDFQESASNHPELLRSKGVVVNVRGKGVRQGRQVSVEKMSESKPTDDASSRIQGTVKTGAAQ